MRKDLEERLVERFPTWFNMNGDIRHTLMPLGVQCENGWFNLLWRLCEDLEPLVRDLERETTERFEVFQVKQKLGGLRFYTNHRSEAISSRIEAAEAESFRTCEICGQAGWVRKDGWIRTRCGDHASI